MSRVSLISLVVLVGVIVPSVAQAQMYVVPSCTDPAVMSRSSYGSAVPCVPLVPVPPTDVPTWLRPVPMPAPTAPTIVAPVYPGPIYPAPVYPAPVYVPPVPAPVRHGIDPWIPLAVRPAPIASPLDLMTQMILLEELATARPRQIAPKPSVRAPAPLPPSTPAEGWMSAFIKGVK
jgi:hypothetical protein